MGTFLIAIGVGLIGISTMVYHLRGIGKLEIDGSMYNIGPILMAAALRLTGTVAIVLIVAGVAAHSGVHSALVVAAVVLVGSGLRHTIAHARESLKRMQLPQPAGPHLT